MFIRMENFSSQHFNTIYMCWPILPNIILTTFVHHAKVGCDNLEGAIGNIVDLINWYDGFQVLLCYSCGDMNCQTLVGMDTWENAQVCFH